MSTPPWMTPRGLRRVDALEMFRGATKYYASLAREIDTLASDALPIERAMFARSRRQYLHDLLDVALTTTELLDGVENGTRP